MALDAYVNAGVGGPEAYALRSHTAQPIGRHAFLTDVARLESVRETMPSAVCWAVLLTNDSAYWTASRRRVPGISSDFNICDGHVCSGTLRWGPNTSASIREGREALINLAGDYTFAWRDYSTSRAPRAGRFRYLAVEIPSMRR